MCPSCHSFEVADILYKKSSPGLILMKCLECPCEYLAIDVEREEECVA